MDYINEAAQRERLKQVGLREDEDLFGPIWKSGRNHWAWLCINVVAALVASRVIGAFESTIDKLVALAALMPIIASVGGNTGNQTVALVIRGLALDQIGPGSLGRFLLKELGIGLMNGAIWGTVVGLFALAIYRQPSLAGLMAGAMALNLAIASVSGGVDPLWSPQAGSRSGDGKLGDPDRHHRQHGILPLPRSRGAVPGMSVCGPAAMPYTGSGRFHSRICRSMSSIESKRSGS